MRVVISGGTGFIGRRLCAELIRAGHELLVLTRSIARNSNFAGPGIELVEWTPDAPGEWMKAIDGSNAVIHLAGKGIFDERWTEQVKRELRESRIATTRLIVDAIEHAAERPGVLISASAIGYYGDTGDTRTQEDAPAGEDFLAQLCRDWEAEAERAVDLGLRVSIPRIGIVLEEGGGALEKMLPIYKLGLGGPFASGRQWFPWIHLDDVIRAITYALDHNLEGPYNVIAPGNVRMAEFGSALGRALHRPSWLPVPAFALKIALGESADFLLAGQHIYPDKLVRAGFEFEFSDVDSALSDLVD